MAAATDSSALDTGQKEANGSAASNGPAREHEDFMYFVAKMNAGSSPPPAKYSPSDPAAHRPVHQQYPGGEIVVPSVAHHTVDSGEEDHPPVPAIPAPGAQHAPRTGGVPPPPPPPYAPAPPPPLHHHHQHQQQQQQPPPPPAGAPMAYVPREIALATVVALMISSNPWISAQELDTLIKTQHPALYDPYSVPGLIQMQLMIAQNLRNGVKFVAANDPKLPPPPPHLTDPRSAPAPVAGPSPSAMPVLHSGPPPPRPPAVPPPAPAAGHQMHVSTQPMIQKPLASSPRVAPMGESTAAAHTPIPTVNEPERGDQAQGGALAQAARVPKKRVMSPGVSSWSNFTMADFINKKKRKRRSLSPGAGPTQNLPSPVREATGQAA